MVWVRRLVALCAVACWVALALLFSWGPTRATEPFQWLGRGYTAGWTIAALMVFRPRRPPQAPDWDDALRHVSTRRSTKM